MAVARSVNRYLLKLHHTTAADVISLSGSQEQYGVKHQLSFFNGERTVGRSIRLAEALLGAGGQDPAVQGPWRCWTRPGKRIFPQIHSQAWHERLTFPNSSDFGFLLGWETGNLNILVYRISRIYIPSGCPSLSTT